MSETKEREVAALTRPPAGREGTAVAGRGPAGHLDRWARLARPVLALTCAAELAMPWFATGERARSAYAFVRAVGGAGLAHGTDARLLQLVVFALPVLAGLTCAAALLRAQLVATVLCAGAGSALAVTGLWVLSTNGWASPGAGLGAAWGGTALMACLWARPQGAPARHRPTSPGPGNSLGAPAR